MCENQRAAAHLFSPVACPVTVIPQSALSPTSVAVRAIYLMPVWDMETHIQSSGHYPEARLDRPLPCWGWVLESIWRTAVESVNVNQWVFWEWSSMKRADGLYFAAWINGVHRGRFVGKLFYLPFLCVVMGKAKWLLTADWQWLSPN